MAPSEVGRQVAETVPRRRRLEHLDVVPELQ
jgi:hypothetical protein